MGRGGSLAGLATGSAAVTVPFTLEWIRALAHSSNRTEIA